MTWKLAGMNGMVVDGIGGAGWLESGCRARLYNEFRIYDWSLLFHNSLVLN